MSVWLSQCLSFSIYLCSCCCCLFVWEFWVWSPYVAQAGFQITFYVLCLLWLLCVCVCGNNVHTMYIIDLVIVAWCWMNSLTVKVEKKSWFPCFGDSLNLLPIYWPLKVNQCIKEQSEDIGQIFYPNLKNLNKGETGNTILEKQRQATTSPDS